MSTQAPDAAGQTFFSFSQPSINDAGLVVFRGRARGASGGGGEPLRGIWSVDTGSPGGAISTLASNQSPYNVVPSPNNITQPGPATFNEFPAFARLDARSNTAAFRGQSVPVYEYPIGTNPDGSLLTTRSGTSGVYTNPQGTLVTGASLLGNVSSPANLSYYQVPNAPAGTKFDQFPGAPSASGNVVAFKGNWTDASGTGQTGIYYRDVVASGGTASVQHIASSGMSIPGAIGSVFGSTAPPSVANGKVVFTGLDNEDAPTAGGIFVAPLSPSPTLTSLVSLGATAVPTVGGATFGTVGEALSFDGRYVGFVGAWGTEMRTVNLACPTDGNAAIKAACLANDSNGTAGDGLYQFSVRANQGVFVVDAQTGEVTLKARTGAGFDDFNFWTYSGAPPGVGGGDEGDADQEAPRWRSSSFVAVDGGDVVFKALAGTGAVGLYANLDGNLSTLLETGMAGGSVDSDAAGMSIVGLGVERDGFRNGRVAINVSMANADAGWAGVYVASVPEPSTYLMMAMGLGVLGAAGRRQRNKT